MSRIKYEPHIRGETHKLTLRKTHRSHESPSLRTTRRSSKSVRISTSPHRSKTIERNSRKAVPNSHTSVARHNVERQMNKYGIPHAIRKDASILAYVAELEEYEEKRGIKRPTETLGRLLKKYGKSGRITLHNVKNVIRRAEKDRPVGLHRSKKVYNLSTLPTDKLRGGAGNLHTRKRR